MTPCIGVLINDRTFKKIRTKRSSEENLQFYVKAARKHGMTVFFTTLSRLDLKNNTASGYMYQNNSYKLVSRTIPRVIHNRTMSRSSRLRKNLAKLARNHHVFNRKTRYSKYTIHRILWKNSKLRPHLPPTRTLSKTSLSSMMQRHSVLYVKPASGSIGQGIVKLARRNKAWVMQTSAGKQRVQADATYAKLQKLSRGKTYIVQQGIDLARYKGRPFDLRVTVQKNRSAKWQVTGIFGKLAGRGKHVTNVARGGTAMRYPVLLRSCGWNASKVNRSVNRVSLHIAAHLDRKLEHLADLGLDVGLTRGGKPYFIEMNGKDLRYGFKKARMYRTWFKSYENPIGYGKYLYRKGK